MTECDGKRCFAASTHAFSSHTVAVSSATPSASTLFGRGSGATAPRSDVSDSCPSCGPRSSGTGSFTATGIWGSRVDLGNSYRFSYPSHSEILTGVADERLKRNEPVYNPNVTVLEYLERLPEYRGKVAVFSSWDLYPYIVNTRRSDVLVHSPGSNLSLAGENHTFEVLRDFVTLQPRGIHSDILTYHLSMEYLRTAHPRVLHIAYSVTDRAAHDGYYDDYIEAIRNADLFIERLWTWLQQDPRYAGKTTLIVTTDHGRGTASLEGMAISR